MELDSVAKVRYAFLRLVDTEADDPDLELHGETATDVIYVNLTRGFRQAQRWMIGQGYDGWRKRGGAITSWSGSDATTGGTYNDVPTDFLKAYGDKSRSALVKVNGDCWGIEVEPGVEAAARKFGSRAEHPYQTRFTLSTTTRTLRGPRASQLTSRWTHERWVWHTRQTPLCKTHGCLGGRS